MGVGAIMEMDLPSNKARRTGHDGDEGGMTGRKRSTRRRRGGGGERVV